MAKCETCKAHCKWIGSAELPEHGCLVGYVPLTNADRIRAMTDEELAEFLNCHNFCARNFDCENGKRPCQECNLDWLKQEAE